MTRHDWLTFHRTRCGGCPACETAAEARKGDEGWDSGAAERDYERYIQGDHL